MWDNRVIVKKGYNDHGYNEFTSIANKILSHFGSQMILSSINYTVITNHGYNLSPPQIPVLRNCECDQSDTFANAKCPARTLQLLLETSLQVLSTIGKEGKMKCPTLLH